VRIVDQQVEVLKEILAFLGGISAQFVSFSTDGQFVAYVTFPEGILWKANRDGSNPMQLTEPSMYVFMPRWSPDGTQILFSDIWIYPTSRSEAYIVSARGGAPRKLLLSRCTKFPELFAG
jgi:eukaryotic-like serine/threonine-protein kinase